MTPAHLSFEDGHPIGPYATPKAAATHPMYPPIYAANERGRNPQQYQNGYVVYASS